MEKTKKSKKYNLETFFLAKSLGSIKIIKQRSNIKRQTYNNELYKKTSFFNIKNMNQGEEEFKEEEEIEQIYD